MRSQHVLVALLALMPLPGFAETQPNPAADLAAITDKASGDRNLRIFLQQIQQIQNRPDDVRMMMEERLYQYQPNGRGNPDEPINFRLAQQVQQAQMRAQYYGQMLTADLNGDGSITKQEVKDTLSVTQAQGAAEAFFSSDANDDSILSPEEIRAAIARQAGQITGRRGGLNPMTLFDFNDDGILTPDERDRGFAALGVKQPQAAP